MGVYGSCGGRVELIARGLMKRNAIVLLAALSLFVGCSDQAKELYETAQFEEVQMNREHATKLYQRLVRDHSSSPYAAKARERLAAFQVAD